MSGLWFEAFRRDPGKAVADLFSGRAGAGSDLRLDVPELLYQQFPPSLADDRARLDDALGCWLSDMREGYASQVQRLGFSVYGKRVGDALVALQLLDLPQTKGRIRADTGVWLRWLLPLRLAPERDPGLECFRLLTRGQPDARHTALWLRLAADPRPEYLTVALGGAAIAAEPSRRAEEPGADAASAVAPYRQDPPRGRWGTHFLRRPLCGAARPFSTRSPTLEPGSWMRRWMVSWSTRKIRSQGS